MKPRRTLLSRLAALFRREKPERLKPNKPARPVREPRNRGIEALEGRIAPAAFVDASTITFNDLDGDVVTVRFSKALFTSATDTLLSDVFKFSDGANASPFSSTGPQYLQLIDLTKTATVSLTTFFKAADGTSISVTAVKGAGNVGDDLTNVGAIEAGGIALGSVVIDGDLGQIDAGRGGAGVKSIVVNSLYKLGSATQISSANDNASTALDKLESNIAGVLGSLEVKTDLYGYVHVVDGSVIFNDLTTPAAIGTVKVGGSLRGAATVATTSDNTGSIQTTGKIGTIQILGLNDPTNASDAAGLVGGGGKNSGSIVIGGSVTSVNITDSLTGGGGQASGSLVVTGTIGSAILGGSVVGGAGTTSGVLQGGTLTKVQIGGDVIGGTVLNSGAVIAKSVLTAVTLEGNLKGGAGENSGSIQAPKLMSATLAGDVLGGTGKASGSVQGGTLTKVTLSGKLTGGGGENSGSIFATTALGTVSIFDDVVGGSGLNSGSISSDKTATSIWLGKNLVGGSGVHSGFIHGTTGLTSVKIVGSATGGTGDRSGSILSDGSITLVSVGQLIGGDGANSGSLLAGFDPLLTGGITTAVVTKGLTGGAGLASGSVYADRIGTLTVGLTSAQANLNGGTGDFSGSILSNGAIGSVTILGSVQGGLGDLSGAIQSRGSMVSVKITGDLKGGAGDRSGYVNALEIVNDDFTGVAGNIGTAAVGGAVQGGGGADSGRVEANGNVGSLTAGSLTAGTGLGSGSLVAGSGFIGLGNAGVITVRGAVAQSTGNLEPSISVDGRLTSLVIGSLNHASVHVGESLVAAVVTGSVTNSTITAVGQAAPQIKTGDVAIGTLLVKGSVTDSNILAGYAADGSAVNADASIGTVSVANAWSASNLVAGVADVNGDGFGNADDVAISGGINRPGYISNIAAIIIGGSVGGSDATGDHFGFTAQKISLFKLRGASLGFDSKAGNQSIPLLGPNDVTAREVAIA